MMAMLVLTAGGRERPATSTQKRLGEKNMLLIGGLPSPHHKIAVGSVHRGEGLRGLADWDRDGDRHGDREHSTLYPPWDSWLQPPAIARDATCDCKTGGQLPSACAANLASIG